MTVEYMRGTFRESLHIPIIEGEQGIRRLRNGLHIIQRHDGKPLKVVMSVEEELNLLDGVEALIDPFTLTNKTVYGIPYEVQYDERESNP